MRFLKFSLATLGVLAVCASLPLAWYANGSYRDQRERAERLRILHAMHVIEQRAFAIHQELAEPCRLDDGKQVNLKDLPAVIQSRHGIPVHIDTRALEEVGLDSDIQLTVYSDSDQSLHYVLRNTFKELELVMMTRPSGLLVITTPEAKAEQVTMRVYNVSTLARTDDQGRELADAMSKLFDSATIASYRDLLLVSADGMVHEEITALLRKVGTGLDQPAPFRTQ
jgi:hypothetical protein